MIFLANFLVWVPNVFILILNSWTQETIRQARLKCTVSVRGPLSMVLNLSFWGLVPLHPEGQGHSGHLESCSGSIVWLVVWSGTDYSPDLSPSQFLQSVKWTSWASCLYAPASYDLWLKIAKTRERGAGFAVGINKLLLRVTSSISEAVPGTKNTMIYKSGSLGVKQTQSTLVLWEKGITCRNRAFETEVGLECGPTKPSGLFVLFALFQN